MMSTFCRFGRSMAGIIPHPGFRLNSDSHDMPVI
jgi:hypothetical protein